MLTWMLSVAWILGLAGSAIVLALVLHFLIPAKGIKVPAVVIGTIGGLVVGICIGIAGAIYYGDQMSRAVYATDYAPSPMPGAGKAKGSNAGGAPPPASEKKKAASDSVSKSRGTTRSLPNNYPGNDDPKKPREDDKNAAKPKSDDTPEK
jgi:hypothetical protein